METFLCILLSYNFNPLENSLFKIIFTPCLVTADGLDELVGQNVWEPCNPEKHGGGVISHIYMCINVRSDFNHKNIYT